MLRDRLSRVFNRLRGVEVPPPGLRVMTLNRPDEPAAEHSFENKQALVDFLKTTALPANRYFDVSGQDLPGTSLSGMKLRTLRKMRKTPASHKAKKRAAPA